MNKIIKPKIFNKIEKDFDNLIKKYNSEKIALDIIMDALKKAYKINFHRDVIITNIKSDPVDLKFQATVIPVDDVEDNLKPEEVYLSDIIDEYPEAEENKPLVLNTFGTTQLKKWDIEARRKYLEVTYNDSTATPIIDEKELIKISNIENKGFYTWLNIQKREYKITEEEVREAFCYSLAIGYRNQFQKNVKIAIQEYLGTDKRIEFIPTTTVISDEQEEQELGQMYLAEVQEFKPDAKVDDIITWPAISFEDTSNWRYKPYNSVVNSLREQCRIFELKHLVEKYKNEKNTLVRGKLEGHIDAGYFIILPDNTLCFLPKKNTLPKDNFDGNNVQIIKAVIMGVLEDTKTKAKAQIILSRVNANFVKALITSVVPEIQEDLISILAIARCPDYQTKLIVRSNYPNISAIGTILGVHNDRINSVKHEIHNENINIIQWVESEYEMVNKIIKPVNAILIREHENIDEETELPVKEMLVVVNDEELALAHGRRAINARLLANYYNSRVAIIGYEKAKEMQLLQENTKFTEKMADKVIEENKTVIIEPKQEAPKITKTSSIDELKAALKTNQSKVTLSLEESLTKEKTKKPTKSFKKHPKSKFVSYKKNEVKDSLEEDLIKKQNEILAKQYEQEENLESDNISPEYNEYEAPLEDNFEDYNEDVELSEEFAEYYDDED